MAGLQTTLLHDGAVCPTPHDGKRGRPSPGARPDPLGYPIVGALTSRLTERQHASTSRGALSSRQMNWTRTSERPKPCSTDPRASPSRTWVSLPERSPVLASSLLSQKARAARGSPDGHDRLFTRLCGPRIPHPHGLKEYRRPSQTKGKRIQKPDRTLGVRLLRGDSCALHPRTRPHDAESDQGNATHHSTLGKRYAWFYR